MSQAQAAVKAPAPASAAPTAAAAPAAAPLGPQAVKLKKGQSIFNEGDSSRAMYLLKSGMIRIFKKKGDSAIEIDTIHSGQVLGELAFLDGNPRSASGEALTDCELIEISGPTFQAVLAKMPDWLKILLKTIVGRLRTSSTRIRQLETASTQMDYSDKDGKRTYAFLSPHDVLKLSTAILVVGSRSKKETPEGIEMPQHLLSRYANQVLGIPLAKLTAYLDVLQTAGVVKNTDNGDAFLKDADFLEALVSYLNEEYILEPSKRHDINLRSFLVMSLMVKHLSKYPVDPKTGFAKVNLAEIVKIEAAANQGKEPFRLDEFPDLVKLGYCTNVAIKDSNEATTNVKPDSFVHSFRLQRIVVTLNSVNEQKRKGGNISSK